MQTCREIQGDGIQLRISIPSAQTGILDVDLQLVSKIIKNLVDNAIKFSQKEKREVVLAYELQKDSLVVAVRDWGIGIEKNRRTAIFSPFCKPRNILRTYPGLGKIWVKSALGRGSTFYFSLPCEAM
jgi:signal transduction histidine kinase